MCSIVLYILEICYKCKIYPLSINIPPNSSSIIQYILEQWTVSLKLCNIPLKYEVCIIECRLGRNFKYHVDEKCLKSLRGRELGSGFRRPRHATSLDFEPARWNVAGVQITRLVLPWCNVCRVNPLTHACSDGGVRRPDVFAIKLRYVQRS